MKTLAELYKEAARVAEMIEGRDIDIYSCIQREGVFLSVLSTKEFTWMNPEDYEFALAIVENKPCFRGDTLYDKQGGKIIIEGHEHLDWLYFSWNPPKPRTVMVEFLVEDVQYLMDEFVAATNIHIACRKALEELK